MKTYLLSAGWLTEDKRTGFGDGHDYLRQAFPSLALAESALAEFKQSRKTFSDDHGSYWRHDCADIFLLDGEGEIVGQPVESWRSKPEGGR